MNNIIKNVLNMIRVVISVLEKGITIISTNPKLLTAYNELKVLLTKIEETAQEQIKDTSGLTKDKSKSKELLANIIAKIANATMVYANDTSNQLLEKKINFSESALIRLSDEMIIEVSAIIYKAGFSLQTSLVDYGIEAADFTKANELRDSFILLNPEVDKAIDKHKVDTAQLAASIKEARKILRKKIDRLMRVISSENAEFYALYKNARAIDDYHGKNAKQQNILEGVGILMGYVCALFDDSLLEDATVFIVDTDFVESTDEDGYFYFDKVPAGTYTLRIVLETYKELIIPNVILLPGDELSIDGALEADTTTV